MELSQTCILDRLVLRIYMHTEIQFCMYVAAQISADTGFSPDLSTSQRFILASSKFLRFQVRALLKLAAKFPLTLRGLVHSVLNFRPLKTEQKCLYFALEVTGAFKQI